jgi:uncharacterized membrane protein
MSHKTYLQNADPFISEAYLKILVLDRTDCRRCTANPTPHPWTIGRADPTIYEAICRFVVDNSILFTT